MRAEQLCEACRQHAAAVHRHLLADLHDRAPRSRPSGTGVSRIGSGGSGVQDLCVGVRIPAMPRRSSPNDVKDLGDLSRLGELVVDKRQGQRASAKKQRRNRHYEKQFIRNALTRLAPMASEVPPPDEAQTDEWP